MRKLLLTLAVLCGTVSAWAGVYKPGTRITTPEAGKKYFISVATWFGSGCTNLLYNNGGTLAKSDLLPNAMVNNESYLFSVEEVGENNTYYIKNSEGKYLQSGDLASTETKTGITVVPYNSVKGSVTCGNDVQACAADGTKIEYNDITDATPIVCVYSNSDNGWRYINNLQIGKSTPFAFYEAETVTEFGEVTTDPSSPILYTIKNIRANAYAEYDGAGRAMNLKNSVTSAGNLFYFTAGATEGTYKIHNYATTKLCAETNSWKETGTDWYIKVSENTTYTGWAISKEETLTADDKNKAWNDYRGYGTSIADYGGNDAGSVWTIEKFEGEVPTLKMSTDSEKFLYFIKNDRVNRYANYSASGTAFAEGASTNYGSYWYFVEKADAEGVPAGFKACYIYNAANNLPVQNHSNGFMSAPDDATYPAKVYYVGTHENTYWGYVIYENTNSGNAWNDYQGASVTGYSYDDAGSIWSIIPADKTEATLKNEATTAKTNALNYIELAELADYYTYSDEAIATAKAAVEEIETDDLASAVSSLLTGSAESNLSTLKESARGTDAPAPGDYIQLKNRQYGKFLKANDADLTNVSAANDYATLWQVEAGEGTNVKLKNAATGKYIGEIIQSTSVGMVDEANAKQFAFTNQTDIYAVFKETTGGGYAYGHIAGGGNLVGWEPGANATQWVLSKVEIPVVGKYYFIECPLFYNVQGVKKALYSNGSNPGWKTLDAADKSFYWTVEQTANGYVLKNANDNKYVLGQANNNTAWTMVDATDGAEYTIEVAGEGQVFIKITGRHLHANGHNGGKNNASNIVSWETNEPNSASAWKFIETEVPDLALAKIALQNRITEVQTILTNCTGEIGYYNTTEELPAQIATAQAVLDGGSKEISAYTDALTALNAGVDALTIVMPTKSAFYRFKHPTSDAYMLSDIYSEDNNRLAMGTLEENKTASVFYYTAEGALLSYAKGQYLPKAVQNGNWTCLPAGSEAPTVTFGAGTTIGRLGFYIGDDATRAYYSGNESFVNAGGNIATNEGYDWVIEEVEWLPVPVNTEVGYATIYSPVELALSHDRFKAYTATINEAGTAITLTEQSVVPANTGVVLEYQEGAEIENGYVLLQIKETTLTGVESELRGTFADSYVADDAYILAKPEGYEAGFYKAKKNYENGTKFLNNGFKAYLPKLASSEARFYVFDFGTETGIEGIESENAKAEIYDLSGRRVQNAQKGLYIVNGKKVIK